jgi:hypothetical protein
MYNKIFKNLTIIASSLIILGTVGCGKIKDFGDTNLDHSGATNPNLAALMTNVQTQLGGYAASTRGGLYAQYWTETQYTDVSLYNTPQLDFEANYYGPLFDLQNIINRNSDPATAAANVVYGSNANQIATARILKAYIYWTLTDSWGSIPYSSALQLQAPSYDPQDAIYKDLLKELTAAVAQFDGGLGMKGDFVYGGNTAQWKKLGNSLRMLIALRLSKVYPNAGDYAATQFSNAATDAAGFITTNADNLTINYPGGAFNNPWYNLFDGRKDYSESKTMTDLLTGLGDTRASAFGANTTGFPYGLPRAQALTVVEPWPLILDPSKRTQSSPVVVVGASSVLLAYAEGIERGWVAGKTTADAQTAYNNGVTQSFAQWGLTVPASYLTGGANYLTGTGVSAIGQNSYGSIPATSTATTTTKLQRIQLQRFIALYPDGTQAWAEWRRTGFPAIQPTTFATNSSKKIPRRYTYGTQEYNLNTAGVAQGVANNGGDTQDTPVWWDK